MRSDTLTLKKAQPVERGGEGGFGLVNNTFTHAPRFFHSLFLHFKSLVYETDISQILFAINSRDVLRGWGWTLASGIVDLALGTFLLMYPVITMVRLLFFVKHIAKRVLQTAGVRAGNIFAGQYLAAMGKS